MIFGFIFETTEDSMYYDMDMEIATRTDIDESRFFSLSSITDLSPEE